MTLPVQDLAHGVNPPWAPDGPTQGAGGRACATGRFTCRVARGGREAAGEACDRSKPSRSALSICPGGGPHGAAARVTHWFPARAQGPAGRRGRRKTSGDTRRTHDSVCLPMGIAAVAGRGDSKRLSSEEIGWKRREPRQGSGIAYRAFRTDDKIDCMSPIVVVRWRGVSGSEVRVSEWVCREWTSVWPRGCRKIKGKGEKK